MIKERALPFILTEMVCKILKEIRIPENVPKLRPGIAGVNHRNNRYLLQYFYGVNDENIQQTKFFYQSSW